MYARLNSYHSYYKSVNPQFKMEIANGMKDFLKHFFLARKTFSRLPEGRVWNWECSGCDWSLKIWIAFCFNDWCTCRTSTESCFCFEPKIFLAWLTTHVNFVLSLTVRFPYQDTILNVSMLSISEWYTDAILTYVKTIELTKQIKAPLYFLKNIICIVFKT